MLFRPSKTAVLTTPNQNPLPPAQAVPEVPFYIARPLEAAESPLVVPRFIVQPSVTLSAGVTLNPASGAWGVAGKTADASFDAFARAIADNKTVNFFAGVSPAVLDLLRQKLATVDLTRSQNRSDCATVYRELIAWAGARSDPAAAVVLSGAARDAIALASKETLPALRAAMIYMLSQQATILPPPAAARVSDLMQEQSPLSPPYAAWVSDGKVVCDFVVDGDANNFETMTTILNARGYIRVAGSTPPVFQKNVGTGDKTTLIEMRLRLKNDDIFKNAGKPGVDIVFYSGHSDLSRNVRRSLNNAQPVSTRQQLFVMETCYGKDGEESVRRKFPDAQMMTTFNPSTMSDTAKAIDILETGIGARSTWAEMQKTLGEPETGNWISPNAIAVEHRLYDLDGDGSADSIDTLFNTDLTTVATDRTDAFCSKAPSVERGLLASEAGVLVASWLNRGVSGYNEALHNLNGNSRVVGAGYFDAQPGDAPVRITKSATGWNLWLNPNFAHMPEPALRAVAAIEFARFCADHEPSCAFYLKPLEALTNALMAAAGTLDYDLDSDDAYWWKKITTAYNLPALSLADVMAAAQKNNAEVPMGSSQNVTEFLAELQKKSPQAHAALIALGLSSFHAEVVGH